MMALRELLKYKSITQVTVLELDPEVVKVSQKILSYQNLQKTTVSCPNHNGRRFPKTSSLSKTTITI